MLFRSRYIGVVTFQDDTVDPVLSINCEVSDVQMMCDGVCGEETQRVDLVSR